MTHRRLAVVGVLLWLAGAAFAPASPAESLPADLEVFVREGCPRCAEAELFLDELRGERPSLRIAIRDVARDADALARLNALATAHGIRLIGVPAFFLRGELLVGFDSPDTTGAQLKALLDGPARGGALLPEEACRAEVPAPCDDPLARATSAPESVQSRLFGRITVRELGLPAFTVVIGLLDGFNPCAMWVLLFLLSLLVNLQSRRKMALIAGTFVVISGLAYFAFMAAWLNVFLLIGLSRTIQVALGSIAVLMGQST